MNKRILSAIAIGSLSTLCSAMFNSHMPATNQQTQQMFQQQMQQREQQLRQQQQQYANGVWAQQCISQGVRVPANIACQVDPFVQQQIAQHHQRLAQQGK